MTNNWRKIPPDDEIHRKLWERANGDRLPIDEDAWAAEWGCKPRAVRYALLRLIEQGRMVRPFHGSGVVIVNPDRWAEFRAEIHARSHVIDYIHQKLWELGRKKKIYPPESFHRVRVKDNTELATWVGQQVLEQMTTEGRLRKVKRRDDKPFDTYTGFLIVSPPLSFISAERKMLHQGDYEKRLEIDPGDGLEAISE